MNEIRKFVLGQRIGVTLKPLCNKSCTQSTETIGISYSTRKFFSEKLKSTVKSSVNNVCKNLDILSQLLSKQCNVVVAQRIRRSYQILLLYRNLYGERLLKEKVATQLNNIRKRPLIALFSASLFNWDKERVTDEELKACYKEVRDVQLLARHSLLQQHRREDMKQWEQIVESDDFKVWRHQIPDTQRYQYRVLGHFRDIPARAFYNTQVDVHYWKDWDAQTIDVSILDRDRLTGSEVIQWLYKFPYPMYPREYVYVRRCVVDDSNNTMVITARATSHPNCPTSSKYVRMETYTSRMVIKPYKGFDENGFSYVMSYSDDPQINLPSKFYNYVASAGCHEFLERMHQAALRKHDKGNESKPGVIQDGTGIYPHMAHH